MILCFFLFFSGKDLNNFYIFILFNSWSFLYNFNLISFCQFYSEKVVFLSYIFLWVLLMEPEKISEHVKI